MNELNTNVLEFHQDAIVLSGETGTKLKSSILEDYYERWWSITSGGPKNKYVWPTCIVEMNAATGEVFIEDTGETLLGSAGHALQLKLRNLNTHNLKVVCIEENDECYNRLKNVISRRWPEVSIKKTEGSIEKNDINIYLIHASIDKAINKIDEINLGNSIYFFDPLLNYDWVIIEKVAKHRIDTFLKIGTEFIIFLFTSDWFLGRKNFTSLPTTLNESEWTSSQKETVISCDKLFGDFLWRSKLLIDSLIEDRQQIIVDLYRKKLMKWFRYVLPLPFSPKKEQLYHLFFCSNYEAGINITKRFYQKRTLNPLYSPDNKKAYNIFRKLYPTIMSEIKGPTRPLEWKILWKIIKEHEYGISDAYCSDFMKMEPSTNRRIEVLDWLEKEGYIQQLIEIEPVWEIYYPRYVVNWGFVSKTFNITVPKPLKPIESQIKAYKMSR